MSYNGSGTFAINTSGQPVVAGTVISSTAFNALTADLATGLSTAITKDGQTTTTARIPFAAGINSSSATDSTSTATGSIITSGGVGVAKALYVGTTANVAGAVTLQSTLGVTGVATFSAAPIYSSLTASSAVATDASKALVSVTNTGTGNNVLATSPTLVTPILGTPQSGTLTNATGLPLSTGVTGVLPEANGGTGTTTGYYGFKNRIINGAMVVAQYGTSSTAGGYCCVDRWKCNKAGTAVTFSQAGVTLNGVSNQALQVTGIAGSTGVNLQHRIESKNCYDLVGNSITIGFWFQQTTGSTFSLQTRLSYATVSDNFASDTDIVTNTTSIPNSTWTFVSFTVNNLTSSAANGLQITVMTNSPAITTGNIYLTLVQLEKGSTATSFDYRPYGTELALCQRYCLVYGGSKIYERAGTGSSDSTTSVRITTINPVPMRTTPTMTYSTLNDWQLVVPGIAGVSATGITLSTDESSPLLVGLSCTIGVNVNFGSSKSCTLSANGTTNARLTYSAEL